MERKYFSHSKEEPHRHQCPKCWTIWAHDPAEIVDRDKAHDCPKFGCDGHQRSVYKGVWEAEYLKINGDGENFYKCAACGERHQTWSATEFCCLRIGIVTRVGRPATGAYVRRKK